MRIAILDDYRDTVRTLSVFRKLAGHDVQVFTDHVQDRDVLGRRLADVDRKGVRIAVSERSAYDLYLSRYLKQAEIVRAPGIAASFDWFVERKLEVLAGLKPKLMEENARLPGSRILEGQITGVQQSIAAPSGRDAAARYLREFVDDVKRSGFVSAAIAKNGVKGVNLT